MFLIKEPAYLLAPEGTLPDTPFSLDLFKPKAPSVDYSKPFAIWGPHHSSMGYYALYHRWTPSLSEPATPLWKLPSGGDEKFLLCAPGVKEGDRYRPDLYNQPDEDGWFTHYPASWGFTFSPIPNWVEKVHYKMRDDASQRASSPDVLRWDRRDSTDIIAWKPVF